MRILKLIGKIAGGVVVGIGVLFGVFYLITIGDYEVAQTVAQDPSIPHVIIDGVTYHAETFGDSANPAVITIHGGPGGDYRSILSLQALSDEYYVVFFDQRGTGLSPRVDPTEISLESAISDLDSIVDYYGNGEKVDLVGHSWGAMLATAYLGNHPEKINHAVLAEPGFLTAEFAQAFGEATKLRMNLGIFYHFLKLKFQSLHVRSPDDDASADYFSYQLNMYQGSGHPQAGYRCGGASPSKGGGWRNGSAAAGSIYQDAIDEDGNYIVDLTIGIDQFTNNVLFIAGECQKIIGVEWQQKQMEFFPRAELAVIQNAGHEMFAENPQESVSVVREYLSTPVN